MGVQQESAAVCLAVKSLKMNSLKEGLELGRGWVGEEERGGGEITKLWSTNRGSERMGESRRKQMSKSAKGVKDKAV